MQKDGLLEPHGVNRMAAGRSEAGEHQQIEF